MSIEEAFHLMENLDYPEGLKRKFAPQYSLLQLARNGEIVCVERYKSCPGEAVQLELVKRYRGTIQLSGSPGMYKSAAEFRERVERSMWLFDKLKLRQG
jgi:nicotinic acid mononucleotide adenylyltransferase